MKNINHKIPRKYPTLVRRAMWKLIECNVNIRKPIVEKWNTMTVDDFLNYKSSKCSSFNSKYLYHPIKVEDVFFSVLAKQSMFKCLTPLTWNKSGFTEIFILPYWSLNRFEPFVI